MGRPDTPQPLSQLAQAPCFVVLAALRQQVLLSGSVELGCVEVSSSACRRVAHNCRN